MLEFLYAILTPVLETITIIAFLAAIVLVLRIIEKMFPKTVARIKARTAWMGWDYEAEEEDPYDGFRIHRSNFIRV